jgi:hypothetical protein
MSYDRSTSRMESLFYTFSRLASRECAETLAVEAYLYFILYQIEDMKEIRDSATRFLEKYKKENDRSMWSRAVIAAYEARINLYNDTIKDLTNKHKNLKEKHDQDEDMKRKQMLAHMYPTHNTVINLHK